MYTKIWRGAAAVLVACLIVFSAPAQASTCSTVDVSTGGGVLGKIFPGECTEIAGSGDVADEPGNVLSLFFLQGSGGPTEVELTLDLDFSQTSASGAQITLFGSPAAPDRFLYKQSPVLSPGFFPETVLLGFADAGTITFELEVKPFTATGGPADVTGNMPWRISGRFDKPFVLPPDPGGGGPMAPIPLPASVWMLGFAVIGLTGISILGRRTQRQCAV